MAEKAVNDWAWAAPTEPNGKMPISLGWRGGFISFDIIGGPYDAFKRGENADFGVCLRAELCPEDLDVLLPIKDFSVPPPAQLEDVEYVIRRALGAAVEGKRVWAGCMGGWGRTGMFLALLAKVADYEDPVGYVRRRLFEEGVRDEGAVPLRLRFRPDPAAPPAVRLGVARAHPADRLLVALIICS